MKRRRPVHQDRPPAALVPLSLVGYPDCPTCHGDGWTRGYAPAPCPRCALILDRARVPF